MLLSVTDYERLNSKREPDLWAAVEEFREETDLEELDVEGILAGVRDPSPGREPEI